ncbi:MAG: CBS domain containing-hemolysin-like protein, partial [Verrucomicrobiales bacterium]
GAAGVGHQAAVLFGEQWLGLYSAVLTLLILVGSEIIPKTLGAVHWRKLAPVAGVLVQVLVVALYPVIVLLRGITNRLSHSTPAERSRDEIESTVLLASDSQHLTPLESTMLSSVLGLRKVSVREIMTPRVVVFMVPGSMTVGEYLGEHADSPFSRIPLYGESADSVTGYVLRSSIFKLSDRGVRLASLQREMPTIFEASNTSDVYAQMIAGNHHIAVVLNEYGGTAGIVTLEDIIETLVGHEIIDELDLATDMREAARELRRNRGS